MTHRDFIKNDWLGRNFKNHTNRTIVGIDWDKDWGDGYSKYILNIGSTVESHTAALELLKIYALQVVQVMSNDKLNVVVRHDENSSYTDGTKNIVIGAKKLFDEYKDSTNKKKDFYNIADAMLGYVVHEVAHTLFTDQKEYARIIESVKYSKLMSFIINIIEDEYIERRTGEAFTGFIKYVAKTKKHVWGRVNKTAKQEKKYARFMNAFVYALRYPSSISKAYFNEFSAELIYCTELLTPYPKSTTEGGVAAQKIYDIVVKFLDDEYEEEQDSDSGSGDGQGEPDDSDETSDDDTIESDQQDSDDVSDDDDDSPTGDSSEAGDDSDETGDNNNKSDDSDADGESKGSGSTPDEDTEDSDDNSSSSVDVSDSDDEEDKEPEKSDAEKEQEKIDMVDEAVKDATDNFEIQKLTVKEVRQTQREQQENSDRKKMQIVVDTTGGMPDYLPVIVDKQKTPYNNDRYKRAVDEVGNDAAVLRTALLELNRNYEIVETELKDGDIDEELLAGMLAGQENIYEKREQVMNKGGAVILLLDASGSIKYNNLSDTVRNIAVLFERALYGLNNIEFYCYQHDIGGDLGNTQIGILYEATGNEADIYKVAEYEAGGSGNRDGQAILYAAQRVAEISDVEDKIMFLVNDGEPSAQTPDGTSPMSYTRDMAKLVKKEYNTSVIQIPIMQSIPSEKMFDDFIPFKGYTDLVSKVGAKLREVITKMQQI